jgi:hypothetical protein
MSEAKMPETAADNSGLFCANDQSRREHLGPQLAEQEQTISDLQAADAAVRSELAARETTIRALCDEINELRVQLSEVRAEGAQRSLGPEGIEQSWRESSLAEVLDHLVMLTQETRAAVEQLKPQVPPPGPQADSTPLPSAATSDLPAYGPHSPYRELIEQIREVVGHRLPPRCTVIVVSKGDPELLKLGPRTAWHFPQTQGRVYAGHYPKDSAAAIYHLEQLRREGGQFLLFPATAFWWLDHYKEFKRYLEIHYPLLIRQNDACLIFELGNAPAAPLASPFTMASVGGQHLHRQLTQLVESLLPAESTLIVATAGDDDLMKLGSFKTLAFPPEQAAPGAATKKVDIGVAIELLEKFRDEGAEFFLIPCTAFEWLWQHRRLKEYLEHVYRLIVRQDCTCLLFSLRPKTGIAAKRRPGARSIPGVDHDTPSTPRKTR